MQCCTPPLFLREKLFLLVVAALELLYSLVVIVDCGRKGTLCALLTDDEGIEMLFEKCRCDSRWGVGVSQRSL